MPGSRRWSQRWIEWFGFVQEAYSRFGEDRVPLAAGAISFFTLLSLFPLLLLAFTLAAPLVREQLVTLQEALGPQVYTALAEQVISAVNYRGVSTLVAVIFGFWSGSQVFLFLESAMNLAWHSQRKRPFWIRRMLAMLMVVIVGTLLSGAILLANLIRFLATLEIPLWGHRASDLPWFIPFLVSIVLPILLVAAIFAIIYRVLPTKQVTFRTVIPSALGAGVLWLLSLHIFSWYTSRIADFTVLYGSLGGVVLLLFWFYYSAFILLLGAEVSATYHRRLVEAGDAEERQVEETDQLVDADQRRYPPRAGVTPSHIAYYGYQSDEQSPTP